MFDFKKVKIIIEKRTGKMDELGNEYEALCKADYIDFWTTKAPSYRRNLFATPADYRYRQLLSVSRAWGWGPGPA